MSDHRAANNKRRKETDTMRKYENAELEILETKNDVILTSGIDSVGEDED